MNELTNQFRVALRGYDPAQVDQRLRELQEAADTARAEVDRLAGRLRDVEEAPQETAPPSFAHLGERVGQILALADQEAQELRRSAAEKAAAERGALAAEADRVREEADAYATSRRSEAESDAARLVQDAQREADERLDHADRDASARLQEAEAVYEDQRAKVARSAADFETTLASRRQSAEAEFTTRMEESQQRLDELQQRADQTEKEAESDRESALREAKRVVEEAQQQAAQLLSDARSAADRVRSESDRELAAAMQRRDSINAQLANVRQMLVTLTGTPAAALIEEPEDESAAGPSSGEPSE